MCTNTDTLSVWNRASEQNEAVLVRQPHFLISLDIKSPKRGQRVALYYLLTPARSSINAYSRAISLIRR
jgi:hypothetical protein